MIWKCFHTSKCVAVFRPREWSDLRDRPYRPSHRVTHRNAIFHTIVSPSNSSAELSTPYSDNKRVARWFSTTAGYRRHGRRFGSLHRCRCRRRNIDWRASWATLHKPCATNRHQRDRENSDNYVFIHSITIISLRMAGALIKMKIPQHNVSGDK